MPKKFFGFYLSIYFLVTTITYSQNLRPHFTNQKTGKTIQVGEDFTYIVKYAFINLGEVRLKIVGKEIINKIPVLKTVAYMDSYEGLPFVNLHQVYQSFIDSSFFPLKFIGTVYSDDTTETVYEFGNKSLIHVKRENKNTGRKFVDSTVSASKRYQDGLSILHYARIKFYGDDEINIPCFVDEKKEKAVIRYFNENEAVSIDALDYEIDCKKLEGETDFVSVYGLTGHFEGWFSNDENSVPVVAKMNVIIGSVTLELIDWNKDLWNPPAYRD